MELTSKQRAQLRGLANDIDTIVQVGKDGIGDNLVKQVSDALEAVLDGVFVQEHLLRRQRNMHPRVQKIALQRFQQAKLFHASVQLFYWDPRLR